MFPYCEVYSNNKIFKITEKDVQIWGLWIKSFKIHFHGDNLEHRQRSEGQRATKQHFNLSHSTEMFENVYSGLINGY